MLEVRNITKTIDTFALKNISFEVTQGEYFVLLGKSGVGKTILLEIISGLLEPDNGRIILDGHDVTREKIQKRHIGIVYQDKALFPHLSVQENLSYPLRCRRVSRKEIDARIEQLAEDIGAIDKDLQWPVYCIDWEQAANELRVDYSEVDYDGETYYYR